MIVVQGHLGQNSRKTFDENTPLFLNKRALIGQEQISLDLPCLISISSSYIFIHDLEDNPDSCLVA